MIVVTNSENTPVLVEPTCVKQLLAYVPRDFEGEGRVCRGIGNLLTQCSHGGGDDAVIDPFLRAEPEEVERIEATIGRREGGLDTNVREGTLERDDVDIGLVEPIRKLKKLCLLAFIEAVLGGVCLCNVL